MDSNKGYQDNERYLEYLKSEDWKQLVKQRLEIDKYRCQMCGCSGTQNNPLECHHLSYTHIYQEQNRVYEDLITLCRHCHKDVHKMMERITAPNGRRGWLESPRVPQVHVFSVDGVDRYGVIEKQPKKEERT